MQIQHLIDARKVESREVFPTVNPATQEVLAEVASGGEAEVNAAVAAARAAFPRWAATPQAQRARIMRKLGDLIAANVPELSDWETKDTGQVIGQTDEIGYKTVGQRFHPRDIHATMLHLLGLDQMKLTYLHNGRYERLTDFGGNVIERLFA